MDSLLEATEFGTMDLQDASFRAFVGGPRMQRARGVGRFSIRQGARLDTLFQEGSAKVRFSASDDGARDAVLINTAGGLAGGDDFAWGVELGPDACCRVVTQACEKVYRSLGETARAAVSLTVGPGAVLEWLPQETILFEQARLSRAFEIDVAETGRLLAVEAVIAGRQAMGETGINAHLTDRWRVRRDGRLIFADNLTLDDLPGATGRKALLDGACAFASVLFVAPDAEERLDGVRGALEMSGTDAAGASAFDGKLFCRILAKDGLNLRRVLVPVMAALRGGSPPPRLWTV
jgi:urease accessory protein